MHPTPTPPTPEIKAALLHVKDLAKAVDSAGACWNKSQLLAYLVLAETFLLQAKRSLN